MRLFDRFDKVYCISLDHRDDRKISFLSQVKKYNLGNFEFYKAVNGNKVHNPYFLNNGAYGLILTNIEILNDCIKNSIPFSSEIAPMIANTIALLSFSSILRKYSNYNTLNHLYKTPHLLLSFPILFRFNFFNKNGSYFPFFHQLYYYVVVI